MSLEIISERFRRFAIENAVILVCYMNSWH